MDSDRLRIAKEDIRQSYFPEFKWATPPYKVFEETRNKILPPDPEDIEAIQIYVVVIFPDTSHAGDYALQEDLSCGMHPAAAAAKRIAKAEDSRVGGFKAQDKPMAVGFDEENKDLNFVFGAY